MTEKLVTLRECRVDDVLARDIVELRTGVVLCNKGYKMLEETKVWLTKFQHSDVYIVDDNPWNKIWDLSNDAREEYEDGKIKLSDFLKSLRTSKSINVSTIHDIQQSFYEHNVLKNSTIMGCVNMIKSIDEYTYAHCMNVGLLAVLIGRWMELPERDIEKLFVAGVLHDIGKYKIDQALLNKKGKLTEEEYKVVKQHTTKGYQLVKNIEQLDEGIKIAVLAHHERMNGSGYPNGLVGKEIHLFAKIVAIADVYDAMISERVYKKKQTPFEVIENMMNEGWNSLDPEILLKFLKNIANYYLGIQVKLSTGQQGEVIFIHPHCVYRPIIKVEDTYIDLDRQRQIDIVDIM